MAVIQEDTRRDSEHIATWFASPGRVGRRELLRQVELVVGNPIVNALLTSVSGLIAVLNEDRQILAVNNNFLAALGITDPGTALGLRPGEALNCVHSRDHRNGCGTGKYCATCGAVLAIVASLSTNAGVERKCILTANRGNGPEDLCLRVKASPLDIEGSRFVLLFVQDISDEERRIALERTFLHDVNNTVMGLSCTVDLMARLNGTADSRKVRERLRRISDSLVREVMMQRAIHENSRDGFQLNPVRISTRQVVEEINAVISSHPASAGKHVTVNAPRQSFAFHSDLPILLRILTNMLVNALEATEEGGEVRFSVKNAGEHVVFRTWNGAVIPEQVSMRIFQLFFTTKQEAGRGLGTFSMKLFGERVLGGVVDFESSEADGTVFTFTLPKKMRP